MYTTVRSKLEVGIVAFLFFFGTGLAIILS